VGGRDEGNTSALRNWWRAATENFKALVLGLVLTIIAVIPDEWLVSLPVPHLKFWFTLLVSISMVLLIVYSRVVDFQHALELAELTPQVFHISDSLKRSTIHVSKDAEVHRRLTIVNASREPKREFILNVAYSKYDSQKLQVLGLAVRGKAIAAPLESYYRQIQIVQENGGQLVIGTLLFDLRQLPGQKLEQRESTTLDARYLIPRAFEKMEEGEWSGLQTLYPTTRFRLELVPPEGYKIELRVPEGKERSILVRHLITRQKHEEEMDRIGNPELEGNILVWNVEHPDFPYEYLVYFRCVKS